MGLEDLKFEITPEWQEAARQNSWASHIPEFATGPQGEHYMRGKGRTVVYKGTPTGPDSFSYSCATCNSDIMGATVSHSIWDGPGPCSGGGEVRNEVVPYCPKCEPKPNFSGTPIILR